MIRPAALLGRSLSFYDGAPYSAAIKALLRDQLGDANVPLDIHEHDAMYAFSEAACGSRPKGLFAYFRAGMQIADALDQIVTWKFGGFEHLGSLLDFACGNGRATRFIAARYDPGWVWGTDVLESGLEFQRKRFGINVFQSSGEPSSFHPPRPFQCIFAASFFSHVPPQHFASWLGKLYSIVEPGGILVFSVHEQNAFTNVLVPESGIHFSRSTEVAELDPSEYGVTVVTDEYVRRAITEVAGTARVTRVPRGLCFEQDIYIIEKPPSSELPPLEFDIGPHGALDHCILRGDTLEIQGWAADLQGAGIDRVAAFLDGRKLGDCRLSTPRSDIAEMFDLPGVVYGWRMRVKPGEIKFPLTEILLVKAISASGKQFALSCNEIAFDLEYETDSPVIRRNLARELRALGITGMSEWLGRHLGAEGAVGLMRRIARRLSRR